MEWDRPPRGGRGPGQQDLQEILEKLKSQFGGGGPFPKKIVGIVVAVLILLLVGINSYYTVAPRETGVVQRFGRFVRTAPPGPHLKLPFGIETVKKVETGRLLQREYGYRTLQPGTRSRFTEKGYEDEARMLSGDLNVVDLQWAVQYKIEEPMRYLFQVQDVEGTLDDISESVVRRLVGTRYADEVLTVGRTEIAEMARREIQEIMDEYRTGLKITTVQLQNANPPDQVKAAFNEVNEARQDKERMINQAQESYNEKIPRAHGQARQLINQAEGYKVERINRAKGETRRFEEVLREYAKSPEVTTYRMYLESLHEFFGRLDRLIVFDEDQRQSLLPFMNLNQAETGPGPLRARPFSETSREAEPGDERSP